jgi:hypothetical protein
VYAVGFPRLTTMLAQHDYLLQRLDRRLATHLRDLGEFAGYMYFADYIVVSEALQYIQNYTYITLHTSAT